MRSNKRRQRGAAMVEFAIVAPIFVMLMFYSTYFMELVRVRLKAQEVSRYVSWQLTSFDYAKYGVDDGQPKAYEDAIKEVMEETELRYKDLDSVEDLSPTATGWWKYENFKVDITNEDVELIDTNILQDFNLPGGEVVGAITDKVNNGANWLLNQWGFDRKGKMQVEVSVDLNNGLFSKNLQMAGEGKGFAKVDAWGGKDLSKVTLKNHMTLTVSDWHLTDGTNAIMQSGARNRAGTREEDDGVDERHGLNAQVERMVLLGIKEIIEDKLDQFTGGLFSNIAQRLPLPTNTFVVSHNYQERKDGQDPCGQPKHMAADGMNNLADDDVVGFADDDDPGDSMRCFDTVPYRDTHKYSRSRYRQMFEARGEYGFGCVNAEATEPTAVSSSTAGTDEADNENCGPGEPLPDN